MSPSNLSATVLKKQDKYKEESVNVTAVCTVHLQEPSTLFHPFMLRFHLPYAVYLSGFGFHFYLFYVSLFLHAFSF